MALPTARSLDYIEAMARPLRIQYEGGLYHVTLRGNERKAIVRDDEHRHRFVDALGASVLRHGAILHLYCLMDNHAHLVVERTFKPATLSGSTGDTSAGDI